MASRRAREVSTESQDQGNHEEFTGRDWTLTRLRSILEHRPRLQKEHDHAPGALRNVSRHRVPAALCL